MKSSTATAVSNLPSSGRRQPARSARTSTARPSSYYARPSPYSANAGAGQAQLDPPPSTPPGFFPAITHFTDGLVALPKEVMRHFTLIKETEGKAHQHNQAISDIIDAINKLPDPPRLHSKPHDQPLLGFSLTNSLNVSAANSVVDGSIPATQQPLLETTDSTQIVDEQAEERRRAFLRLRESLKTTLGVLDEKNMVLASANDTLSRQLARLDNVVPYIENEVSEEARLGSNTHWALAHMRDLRKAAGTTANDRSRRDVQAANSLAAAAAAVHEGDIAATRSEARREALLAKRRGNIDSDFDERPPTKRGPTGSKARKLQDASLATEGKTTASGQPAKRRRVDKTGGATMERSASGAAPGAKAGAYRDREAAGEPVRKKNKALPAASGAKKRGPVGSPSLASSPTRGTFPTSTNKEVSSAPRTTNARARQNSAISTKSAAHDASARNKPPSTTSSRGTANNANPTAADPSLAANAASRSLGDTRSSAKEAWPKVDDNTLVEQEGVHGALVVDNSTTGSPLKREETEPAEDAADGDALAATTSAAVTTTASYNQRSDAGVSNRSRGGSRATKPSTPIEGTDSNTVNIAQPMARSRSTRGINTNALRASNRNTHSPTLGAAVAASPRQRAANKRTAHIYADSARTSPGTSGDEVLQGSTAVGKPASRDKYDYTAEIGEEGEEIDPNQDVEAMSSPDSDEPRYCICNGPSYGHMIGCDNKECPREWFHLACVGMTRLPAARTKWYCDECKELLRKKGGAGSR